MTLTLIALAVLALLTGCAAGDGNDDEDEGDADDDSSEGEGEGGEGEGEEGEGEEGEGEEGEGEGGDGEGEGAYSVVNVIDPGFSEPAVVVDDAGVFHVVYVTGFSASYGRCAPPCTSGDDWEIVTLIPADESLVLQSRLALDPDGSTLHAAIGVDSGADEVLYLQCSASCTNAASWSTVDLTPMITETSLVFEGSPLVVDGTGRVALITSDRTSNGRLLLVQCPGNCADGASWRARQIREGGRKTAMTAVGDTLHQVLNDEDDNLVYRVCSGTCDAPEDWEESPPLFAHTSEEPTAIAVTSSGSVTIAYNQGSFGTGSGQPFDIIAQDDRLLAWTCDADCAEAASWSGVLFGITRDGAEGLQLIAVDDALVMVHADAETSVDLEVCTGNCGAPESWTGAEFEDFNTVRDDLLQVAFATCDGQEPTFYGWDPSQPSVAVSPVTGSVVIAHAPSLFRTCDGGVPSRQPSVGRLLFLP